MSSYIQAIAGGIAVAISSVVLLFSGAAATHSDTVFPRDFFYHGAGFVNPYPGYSLAAVGIRWTLTGTGYPNSTMTAYCSKDEMRCYISSLEEISDDLAILNPPPVLTVIKYSDADPIVATHGDDSVSCFKTTLNIYRYSSTAELTQEPINRSQTQCKDAENIIYRWTIGDPQET